LTANLDYWASFGSAISAAKTSDVRTNINTYEGALTAEQTTINTATFNSRLTVLLSRLLVEALPNTTPIIQFVNCSQQGGESTVAFNTAKAAATVLGKTLFLDARLKQDSISNLEPTIEARPSTWNILPDAFTPGLYYYRICEGPSGSSLLFGDGRRDVLSRLAAPFRLVIIDSPIPSLSPSANTFAPFCLGCVIVVEAAHTSRATVLDAIMNVRNAGGRVIGTVLDNVPAHQPSWMCS
jgi:Mrp family chromosome partitioning ATPase